MKGPTPNRRNLTKMAEEQFKLDPNKQYDILEEVHETKSHVWLYCHTKNKPLRVNKKMYENIQTIRRVVRTSNDYCVIVVDGKPGVGKSTLVSQLAYILSNGKVDVPNVHFTEDQIQRAFSNINRGDVLWIDEAFNFINKRTSRGKGNMTILSNLQICRSKGPIIILTLPCVFDLDKQVVLYLTNMLVHVVREREFGKRGGYMAYNSPAIKQLYIRGREYLNYNIKQASGYFGNYPKLFTLDEEAYELKKHNALIEMNKKQESADTQGRKVGTIAIGTWAKFAQLTGVEISKFTGIPKRTVYDYLKNYKEKYSGGE